MNFERFQIAYEKYIIFWEGLFVLLGFFLYWVFCLFVCVCGFVGGLVPCPPPTSSKH